MPIYFTMAETGTPKVPNKAYPGDAGWDLYTSRKAIIPPHSFKDVHVDVSVAMPPGLWGLIIGRSSTVRRHGLRVEPGVIDNGYRGELFIGVWNLTNEEITVDIGTRLAQFIPFQMIPLHWSKVDELPPSDRGTNSFGSSGV